MDVFKYALLGIVQGLTEFLPVSSSGHLVLLQHWLGIDTPGMTVEVVLHVATTISVLIVYGRGLFEIFRRREWSYIGLLLLACLATAVLFLPFKDQVEAFSDSPQAPRWVGVGLLCTGLWQLLADWRLRRSARLGIEPRPLTWWRAGLIGLAMGVAGLFRGFSRSGATIGTALQLGMDRAEAARFSFLSSVPVVLGAALLKADEAQAELAAGTLPGLPLAAGFVCSLLAGIAAIWFVEWALKRAQLSWFGAYCVILGSVALVLG